jgi:Tfp pilus assembly protein FimV
MCHLQAASDAAAASKPWAADAVAALVDGGLGSFRLAHAESAAQQAQLAAAPWWGPAQEDPYKPHTTRCLAGDTLWGAAQNMTPAVSTAIFKRGLVEPLLEVG